MMMMMQDWDTENQMSLSAIDRYWYKIDKLLSFVAV